MDDQELIVAINLILLQMRDERKYVKTKPYSQTLTERLHERLIQHKLAL